MKKKLSVAIAAAMLAALPASAALAQEESATVYVVHAVPGVNVDVWINGEPGPADLLDFAPTEVAGPLEIPAGEYDIEIFPAGSDYAEGEGAIRFQGDVPAANLTLVAHLDADGNIAPAPAVFVNDTSETAAGEANVVVRHTAAAPEVELSAGGTAIDTFSLGEELGPLGVPAGSLTVGVGLPGDDPFFTADLDLAAGTAYFVHAYVGDPSDLESTVASFEPIIFTIDVGEEAAADDEADDEAEEEVEQPTHVDSGTGGLLDAGLPVWVAALMVMGALGIAAPAVATARRRS
jgi:hypothetical protein